MSGSAPELGKRALAQRVISALDPRVGPEVLSRYGRASTTPVPLAATQQLVLAGQRASGKSTLLPMIAELTGRPPVDLDAQLEARRPIREWLREDPAGF